MTPRFPVYIVSKGRADHPLTMRALDAMGVPFRVIVEAQELTAYAAVVGVSRCLVLDADYLARYDTCDTLGDAKSRGPGAARNFAWDHAVSAGAPWHWVCDDNIRAFYRAHNNRQIRVSDGTVLRCMEDFCLRYQNVSMAGPNYEKFAKRRDRLPPFVANTRIYSCNLIRNDVPFRWRGRYNEDTDLSLRMLKAGWVTVQFNAFLQGKMATQTIPGGCNADFYQQEGTRPKSEMLVRLHPDVARLTWRFNRWHHFVDYRPFRGNKLVRRRDLELAPGADNYGMRLVELAKD